MTDELKKESSNLLLEINKGLKHLNTKEGNIGIYDTKFKNTFISLIKTENSSLEVHEKNISFLEMLWIVQII